MDVADFQYELPEALIAQEPLPERDASRLLVLPRDGGSVSHRLVRELPELLRPGDLLVRNDTLVIPARLIGSKPTGGRVEILLDRPLGTDTRCAECWASEWSCLLRSSKPLRADAVVELSAGGRAICLESGGQAGAGRVRLLLPQPTSEYLAAFGQVPLPPYIRRRPDDERSAVDRERYQTIWARHRGAVAAPTAGLHFTPRLLDRLGACGVESATITLHVGPGTFQPVRCARVEEHRMHPERVVIDQTAATAIEGAHTAGRRVVALGTTVVRALEGGWTDTGLRRGEFETDLFIRPGFRFRVVDALLTNFHLPGSTLLMLVAALAGRERVLGAYREAVAAGYRFYSYGDAMCIV